MIRSLRLKTTAKSIEAPGARGTLSVEPNDAITLDERAALSRLKIRLVALSDFCDKAVSI